MNINWNAEKYTADFSFVPRYGNDVTGLIDAAPGSSVLVVLLECLCFLLLNLSM